MPLAVITASRGLGGTSVLFDASSKTRGHYLQLSEVLRYHNATLIPPQSPSSILFALDPPPGHHPDHSMGLGSPSITRRTGTVVPL